jgi:hypothetical protein
LITSSYGNYISIYMVHYNKDIFSWRFYKNIKILFYI